MNKKVYLKLYISIFIFAFLIFIIPFVLVNMIGYMILGLSRPVMFISKFIDLLIFVGISALITLIVVFIIFLVCRTIKKDDIFIRTINGLEFDKSNIIQIKKKKFGLMTLISIELNNYKNIHYFFNNDEELKSYLEENDLLSFLVEKEKKFNKLKISIKGTIFVIVLAFVFRDALTSNKTFRKSNVGSSFDTQGSLFRKNENYIVTNSQIFDLKNDTKIQYTTTSTYPVDEEYFYRNSVYDLNLYPDYFIAFAVSRSYKRYGINNQNGQTYSEEIKLIEEKIDYNGKNLGIVSEKNTTEHEYYINSEDYCIYVNLSDKDSKTLSDYVYSRRGKILSFNVSYGYRVEGDYIYSIANYYKKSDDIRYIWLSGLYRFKTGTNEVEVIGEFKGKRILAFNDKYIMYIDYKTIYKIDLVSKEKEKVVKLKKYDDFSLRSSKKTIIISCWSPNKFYFIDDEYRVVGVVS